MSRAIALALALLLAACATTSRPYQPTGHQPAAEAEVLAALDAYMLAISANDLDAMSARQTRDGMTYRHAARADGAWEVLARSNAEWVAPERRSTHALKERYWSPTVLIRGPMALVWAPYEFHVDGSTSHCGIDAFSFSRIDGAWKVSNAMWTVEPGACAELRPSDSAAIRPRD